MTAKHPTVGGTTRKERGTAPKNVPYKLVCPSCAKVYDTAISGTRARIWQPCECGAVIKAQVMSAGGKIRVVASVEGVV